MKSFYNNIKITISVWHKNGLFLMQKKLILLFIIKILKHPLHPYTLTFAKYTQSLPCFEKWHPAGDHPFDIASRTICYENRPRHALPTFEYISL